MAENPHLTADSPAEEPVRAPAPEPRTKAAAAGESRTERAAVGQPRTERGRRTRRAILDAAAQEFGARGFHATGITDITRRASVALGSFYTYFAAKEDVFRAVVADLSAQVGSHVAPRIAEAADGLAAERLALEGFLDFVADNQLIYRIIDESEFVAPDSHRSHYGSSVQRILGRLRAAADRGEVRADVGEVEAWAIMGMNVFLGMRFGVWDKDRDSAEVAAIANRILSGGLR